jgi:hypothetical protein
MTEASTVRAQKPSGPEEYPSNPLGVEQRRVCRARQVAAVRAGMGLLCLVAPGKALVASQRGSPVARRVMRILGARHLTQAAIEGSRPTAPVLMVGAGVDAVHALTCLGFAVIGGARWRHGVLLNAGCALGFCVATAATARTRRRDTPTRGRSVHDHFRTGDH